MLESDALWKINVSNIKKNLHSICAFNYAKVYVKQNIFHKKIPMHDFLCSWVKNINNQTALKVSIESRLIVN